MELVFIDTPNHGYLKVSVSQLSELGLSNKDFSNYSFKWKNYLLLEEDCDAKEDHACTYDGFANAYACKPVGPCTPQCEGKACGSDACGGWCAPGCPEGWSCLAGPLS